MTSDAPTNKEKHVRSKVACVSCQQYTEKTSLLIGQIDVVHYDVTLFPAIGPNIVSGGRQLGC